MCFSSIFLQFFIFLSFHLFVKRFGGLQINVYKIHLTIVICGKMGGWWGADVVGVNIIYFSSFSSTLVIIITKKNQKGENSVEYLLRIIGCRGQNANKSTKQRNSRPTTNQ